MTTAHNGNDCPIFQSLMTLRDSISAFSCVADLVPDDLDNSGIAIGILLKRLSERLESDLSFSLTSYFEFNASRP